MSGAASAVFCAQPEKPFSVKTPPCARPGTTHLSWLFPDDSPESRQAGTTNAPKAVIRLAFIRC
jgi:hypothetical protein